MGDDTVKGVFMLFVDPTRTGINFIQSWKDLNSMRHAYVTRTHLEDANEILFVNTEKMAVVFSQDDGGGTRSIIQQS